MVGEDMTLLQHIQSYTGIADPVVLDIITGCVFGVGFLLIIALFVKFLFRLL